MQVSIRLTSRIETPIPVRYVGWRCLHGAEGGYSNPTGMPAVRPSVNARPIKFYRALQEISYALNEGRLLRTKWRALYGSRVAFTNGQSWPDRTAVDYINGLDIGAEPPYLMKAIIMGGGFYRGVPGYSLMRAFERTIETVKAFIANPRSVMGNFGIMGNIRRAFTALTTNNILTITPGVGAIDVNQPMPSVEKVIAEHWFFHAVTSGDRIYNFPHCGEGVPVLIPYFLAEPTPYPLEWFEPWDREYLPDPLKFYV